MSGAVVLVMPPRDLAAENTCEPTRDLAGQINDEHDAACRDASSAIDHARRCGLLLIEAKKQQGHGNYLAWLDKNCRQISHSTAQGWVRLARANPQRVAGLSLRAALKEIAGPREASNSGDTEWFSPRSITEAAHRLMGGIDLDPASNALANDVVQATRYFDREADGLRQPWVGRIFINPPYINTVISAFVDRLLDHVRRGDVTQAVVLVNNATDTPWFQSLSAEATGVCFPLGRVHYWLADDRKLSSVLQGQAIHYFGPRRNQFGEIFGPLGLLVRRDCR